MWKREAVEKVSKRFEGATVGFEDGGRDYRIHVKDYRELEKAKKQFFLQSFQRRVAQLTPNFSTDRPISNFRPPEL